MKIRSVIAVAIAALLIGAPSGASEPHGISCRLTGVLLFKPALTAAPQDVKIGFKGHMTHCVSTTGITSGAIQGTATSTGSCAFGQTEGEISVRWDDGTKTLMPFTAISTGNVAPLSGTAGTSNSEAVGEGDPIGGLLSIDADPARCVSGIKTATFQGQGFGGNAR